MAGDSDRYRLWTLRQGMWNHRRNLLPIAAVAILAWSGCELLLGYDDSFLAEERFESRSLGLSNNENPKTITAAVGDEDGSKNPPAWLKGASTSKETSHDGDQLCIAKVDDGKIVSASVVDEGGHLHLSLPKGYRAEATVECTQYERIVSAEDEDSKVIETSMSILSVEQGGLYEPHICGDSKYFRPGYYDQSTLTWVDHCSGRAFKASEEARVSRLESSPLSPANCPMVADHLEKGNKEPLWISFVGDSVTRQLYNQILMDLGVVEGSKPLSEPRMLARFVAHGVEFWFSFQLYFINPELLGEEGIHNGAGTRLPHTWGEYAANQEGSEYKLLGGSDSDPPFMADREPNIVLYSPGYHSSSRVWTMHTREYQAETEAILTNWREVHRENCGQNSVVPPMHVFLNMMPAPWMVPDKHAEDRTHRTLLNEHRRNLAIMRAARKFDFVRGVLDLFSIELPFNGSANHTAHQDAVHLKSFSFVMEIAGSRVFEAICSSDLDGKWIASESKDVEPQVREE